MSEDFTLYCKDCKHYLVCLIRQTVNRFESDFPDLTVNFQNGYCVYKNEDLDYESLIRLKYIQHQQKKAKE
jgi:hypothetical protein